MTRKVKNDKKEKERKNIKWERNVKAILAKIFPWYFGVIIGADLRARERKHRILNSV